MEPSCYVGTTDPARPAIVRARYVRSDGSPSALLEHLRGIWADAARGDTEALIDVILTHDWDHLGPDTTSDRAMPGQRRIPGVGVTLDDTDPEPAIVFPLSRAHDLDTYWIYLINPADDTVMVHVGDGEPAGVHPLDLTAEQESAPVVPTAGSRPGQLQFPAGHAAVPRSRPTCPVRADRRRPG